MQIQRWGTQIDDEKVDQRWREEARKIKGGLKEEREKRTEEAKGKVRSTVGRPLLLSRREKSSAYFTKWPTFEASHLLQEL